MLGLYCLQVSSRYRTRNLPPPQSPDTKARGAARGVLLLKLLREGHRPKQDYHSLVSSKLNYILPPRMLLTAETNTTRCLFGPATCSDIFNQEWPHHILPKKGDISVWHSKRPTGVPQKEFFHHFLVTFCSLFDASVTFLVTFLSNSFCRTPFVAG